MTSTADTKSRMGFRRGDPIAGDAYLLVIENESSSLFHLPRSGAVVVGRGDAELQLTHPSVSRRHATLRIDDGVIRVADLGSHNGTRVNGEPVAEARRVASGDLVMVGDVVLVLHVSEPAPAAPVEYSETEWRRRLAEELDRATTYRRALAIVAIAAPELATFDAVAAGVRRIDVLGRGDDGQLLALLPELDRPQTRAVVAG